MKLLKVLGNDSVVIREGEKFPEALVSLETIKSIVTSVRDIEAHISKHSDKDLAVAVVMLRDKLNRILVGIESMARELGVELQTDNPEFDFEKARRELAEAVARLHGPDSPDAA